MPQRTNSMLHDKSDLNPVYHKLEKVWPISYIFHSMKEELMQLWRHQISEMHLLPSWILFLLICSSYNGSRSYNGKSIIWSSTDLNNPNYWLLHRWSTCTEHMAVTTLAYDSASRYILLLRWIITLAECICPRKYPYNYVLPGMEVNDNGLFWWNHVLHKFSSTLNLKNLPVRWSSLQLTEKRTNWLCQPIGFHERHSCLFLINAHHTAYSN